MFTRYFKKIIQHRRQKEIAKQVRAGIVPKGVPVEEIWEALAATRAKNQTELHGFLSAKIYHDGHMIRDLGLQSVREVTSAFAEYMVDCMVTSGDEIDNFRFHKMGSGSTAETDTQTDLVATQDFGTDAAVYTHGATSQIFKTIDTILATSTYEVREHGIFNTLTGGVMLDRSLVTAIALNTDDEVEWTYNLTVNAGG